MKFTNILIYFCILFALIACASPPQVPRSQPATAVLPTPTQEVDPTVELATELPPLPTITEPVPTPTEIEKEITFIKTVGGNRRDRGINLIQARDGGYAIVGYTSSPDAMREDVYLVRMDYQGEILWSQIYGGEGRDNGWDLLETEDGGFIIVGFTNSFGAGEMDIYLIRVDVDGNMIWEHTYGGPNSEFGWALAQTDDGGYVLAGQTDSFGAGEEDGYLVKVNAQGEELWSQTFGGEQEDRLFSIDLSADSGFVLVGTTRSFGLGERDLYLVKTNNSGELVWSQQYGEAGDDVGHAVRQTADNGYIVTGYTRSFGASSYDSWLLKFDEADHLQWQTFYGGEAEDRTIYGEQTDDGGYIMIGFTKSFDSMAWDLFLVKTDSLGEVSWHQTFGGRADDTGYTVRQTFDLGFVLTGETYSSGEGNGDMYVIKVNQAGELVE
ncbi:MAG: hypothetical protein GY943_17390 [Chloroflexi bacterium]|nr:hypothetical protein [Chloroflexota bacterium]